MNQPIEDASRKDFEAWWSKVAFSDKHTQYDVQLKGYPHHETQIAWYSWQAARQSSQSEPVATADYVAYLYRDHNGTLKLAQEVPPPDNAFPVFTTNIRFLDVARLVLDDNVDLILEHGGVKLWEALVTKVNKDYAERNHEQ